MWTNSQTTEHCGSGCGNDGEKSHGEGGEGGEGNSERTAFLSGTGVAVGSAPVLLQTMVM